MDGNEYLCADFILTCQLFLDVQKYNTQKSRSNAGDIITAGYSGNQMKGMKKEMPTTLNLTVTNTKCEITKVAENFLRLANSMNTD